MSSARQQEGGKLSRVESYQWPSGHAGHLSEGHQDQLAKFKQLCEQKGYYHPGHSSKNVPPSHDDETLLRYLRARKFIPKDAFGQFKDTEDWRQENQLDTLYDTMDVHEYEQTRRLYPQWTGRRDKRGIPFYVFEVANLDAKVVNAYANDSDRKKKGGQNASDSTVDVKSKVPRKMLRLFALYENLCRFVLPLCSAVPDRPNSETPVSQSSNVVDLNRVGLAQFWKLRAHLQDSSALATAHYPETLDRIFVVGAPGFFSTIWDWAKNWFDPITVAKISILNKSNTLSTLEKFVDRANIPKKYGGDLDWSFGDLPNLDDPALEAALKWKQDVKNEKGHKTFPAGPMKWEYTDEGDLVAVAIGSENGAPRKQELAQLHPSAGVARLALSPGRNPHSDLFKAASGQKPLTAVQSQGQHPEAKADQAVPAAAVSIPAAKAATVKHTTNGSIDKMTSNRPTDADLNIGKSPDSAVEPSSIAGTYTVPYRDHENQVSHPPVDARQGTSSTRFEQQSGTHAEGQLAHSTPHKREDGLQGEHAVMEPRTVGQAPKETPLVREEEPQPTIVEQAQEYAGQAVEAAKQVPATVLSAVGMGEKAEEVKPAEPEKKDDERVDALTQEQLEEFMREQSKSSIAERAVKQNAAAAA
ncbi:SEC14 cytosolic factor [Fulvia fulva]|nr:SEC14 cytosolic factor [Fulvia fulva]